MTAVRIVATTKQFVSVGAKGALAVTEGLPYIPGSTLRGALAARWLREHDQERRRAEFIDVFERSRFGPLLPAGGQLVPRSYREHKYGAPDGCVPLHRPDPWGEPNSRCPLCGQQLVPVKQALKPPAHDPTSLMTSRPRVELTDQETSKEGQLFERTGLRSGTPLSGHAFVTGPAREWLGEQCTIRVGGAASVSGEVQLKIVDEPPEAAPRLKATGRDVTLLLGSPGIFVDSAGRPASTPSRNEIAEIVQSPCEEIRDVAARWLRVGGWHNASGLPKPAEWAVDIGSSFTARFATEPSEQGLERLLRHGIGLRRNEGFGWLSPAPRQGRERQGS
ncbi:type III-B CRISPR module-associated Cmr3 family protein [Phytoactinopolyspora limicola]|uniref:type III-B CRISPR module-associated Cmr3 family protein n=1 Tax=Phytoactinopolyspora limicola TaxID=2715536 RepID=UPI0014096A61|nr:type III-B CRISPR module-associated Cmr3 family protein [Phytoactinopolyspora limicola]